MQSAKEQGSKYPSLKEVASSLKKDQKEIRRQELAVEFFRRATEFVRSSTKNPNQLSYQYSPQVQIPTHDGVDHVGYVSAYMDSTYGQEGGEPTGYSEVALHVLIPGEEMTEDLIIMKKPGEETLDFKPQPLKVLKRALRVLGYMETVLGTNIATTATETPKVKQG